MLIGRINSSVSTEEAVAFSVLAHSIHARSSRGSRPMRRSVSITPLMLSELKGVMTRERHPLRSTDFSFSRFLTPYLSDYSGWSVFMDCDMLVLDDIVSLYAFRDEQYSVMVVKHDHVPKESRKFLDQPPTPYRKKNWSSVMLFNNTKCPALTPEYVNTTTGLELHQFKWLANDDLIGELPAHWNHPVGYHSPRKDASLVHYTLGGPYFKEYRDCEYAQEWRREQQAMLRANQRS